LVPHPRESRKFVLKKKVNKKSIRIATKPGIQKLEERKAIKKGGRGGSRGLGGSETKKEGKRKG